MPSKNELTGRPPAYGLIVALIVLSVAFVAATAVTQYRAMAIDAPSHAIAANSAAAVERLADAGRRLREFEQFALAEATEAPSEERRRALDEARREISADLEAYLALPAFGGERAIWNRVQRNLADLDEAMTRRKSTLSTGDPDAAEKLFHTEVRPLIERTEKSLDTAIAFNAAASRDFANDIGRVRRQTLALAVVLSVVCVAALAAIVVLGLKASNRYARKLEEQRVFLARQIEELSAFSSRVAHDILGPLTGLSLSLDLAERRQKSPQASQAAIARARSSLQRVRRIVEDLLEFARSGAHPEKGSTSGVRGIVDDVLSDARPLAEQAGAQLIAERVDDGMAACSPGVLTSIVSNLVRNAIKYLGDAAVRRVAVRASVRDAWVRIEVADTGPGIAADLHENLFKPFVRGHDHQAQGLGLGLATVKRLVDSHGGRVSFQTALGRGTTFWVELPRALEVPATVS